MKRLCQYRDLLGRSRQGVHAYRLFNLAIVDVILTFLGAWVLQRVFFPKFSYLHVFFCLFLVGILLHWLFCVDTTVTRWLGLVY